MNIYSIQSKENYLSSIFSLMTANRLLDACQTAVDNNDFRLALLLSQSSGSNESVRAMLRKQLNEWFTSNVRSFLSFFLSFFLSLSIHIYYIQTHKQNRVIAT